MMHSTPLAHRVRPQNITEIVGQQHLVGPNKIISRMITAKRLTSMLLYGPPGVGKTSIAHAISGSAKMPFRTLNAVTNNKKDLEKVIDDIPFFGNTVLLIDEVHRLDKPKQDFLLPHLESGKIILIGATTSNPYHAITPALRSRCHIFELKSLTTEEIIFALKKALDHPQSNFSNKNLSIRHEAFEQIALHSSGDLRGALNCLELAVLSTPEIEQEEIVINAKTISTCIQKKLLTHDKDGDTHYDVLSALQKSIRGSDTNAALHYMARLIEAGDLTSLTRRLLVIAYEDIGLANPQAGARMLSAICAAEKLGLPEARIPIAVAVIECCLSPKSNSALTALDEAILDVRHGDIGEIPTHIKDSSYSSAKKLGHGINYKYPHNYESGWVEQTYLPTSLKNKKYYRPKCNSKFESGLATIYKKLLKNSQS